MSRAFGRRAWLRLSSARGIDTARRTQDLEVLGHVRDALIGVARETLDRARRLRKNVEQLETSGTGEGFADSCELLVNRVLEASMVNHGASPLCRSPLRAQARFSPPRSGAPAVATKANNG